MKNLKTTLALAAFCVSQTVFAFEVEHDAHEHGSANLNVILEGEDLVVNFRSPAMNIVGFEHAAKNKKDQKKVKAALDKLQNTSRLLELPDAAECKVEKIKVLASVPMVHEKGSHKGDHHDEHDEHKGHHDKHDHHDEHKGHHDKHAHHDEHKDHADGSAHSEFELEYRFHCHEPENLTGLNVGYFKAFPSLSEIEAQVITSKKQALSRLDSDNTKLELK